MNTKTPNRWRVFMAAWFIIFCASAIAIYSVFAAPMAETHGWSIAQFNRAYTIYNFVMAIVAIFAGFVADRFGARILMYAGGFLYGLGWFLAGFAGSLPALYATLGATAGAGAGLVYNAALITALRWFPDKGGTISGLLLSAAAVGPFLLSPVSSFIIRQLGVEWAFHILGVLYVVVIGSVGWMMARPPAAYSPPGGGGAKNRPRQYRGKSCTWHKMLQTPLFYLLFLCFACASISGTMMVSSISGIAQMQLGVSASYAALIVSISTLANLGGRLAFGILFDKLGATAALLLNITLSIAALAVMAFAHIAPLFIACVVVLGFSYGGILVMFPPLTASLFGTTHQSTNYAVVFLGYALGSFIGPSIASPFLDGGASFTPAYFIAAALSAVGLLFTGLLHRGIQKQRAG